MVNDIARLIFDQFVEMVVEAAAKKCKLDVCDFDYHVRDNDGNRLMKVIVCHKDECCRQIKSYKLVDITNICFRDVTSCKWTQYLEKMARDFACEICPERLVVIKDKPRPCREQPKCWAPFACKNTTTVIRPREYPVECPEVEVIVQDDCECVPVCRREPCCNNQNTLIIKYQDQPIWNCGDCTRVVCDGEEHGHSFAKCDDNVDYNNHKWNNGCCKKTSADLGYYDHQSVHH